MSESLAPSSHQEAERPSWDASPGFCPCWFLADFVLVWEEDLRLGQQQDSATRDKTDTHAAWRKTFLDNLRAAGLCVDQVPGVSGGLCNCSMHHDLPDKARGHGVQRPGTNQAPKSCWVPHPSASSPWLWNH